MLLDAGPLVAIIDKKQTANPRCRVVLKASSGLLITTWPVLAEAFYLVGRIGQWTFQRELWELLELYDVVIHHADKEERGRLRELMDKYSDTPMDLADASLVAAAETLGVSQIFTLDSDFYIYRPNDTGAFTVVP